MRLNKYLAENTDLSRRKADLAIQNGRVRVNDELAIVSTVVDETTDTVKLDGNQVKFGNKSSAITIMLNKPVGYVCSKDGQGSRTIYELLPDNYVGLNIAGRLDKDSSGLVVLTSDGKLLNELTHPSNKKQKTYEVKLDKEISNSDLELLVSGVDIGDERPSRFKNIKLMTELVYEIILEEGRNRQIRRTFDALGYTVEKLHRVSLGPYKLAKLKLNDYIII
jgi:pseudouridine synthase